jgi:winged helix DNA-binding protein
MEDNEILRLRLRNHHLLHPDFLTPEDVVSHFGAVQAQDYAAAKWSLGLRIRDATDTQIEQAFNEGKILRTHVMRPTWHFVLPEHIRWIQELTSPNVKKLMGHYNRKLELTDEVFAKSTNVIVKALTGNTYLTRQEIKKLLDAIGIHTNVQRLAHLLMWPELDGVICSGPRRGKQFTYALLDERAPETKKIRRADSLAKLALLYITSHGPVQVKDFSWWSGLSMSDARDAFAMVGKQATIISQEGKEYYSRIASNQEKVSIIPRAHLLSIYDEYAIAYRDRSDISNEREIERMIAMGNALTGVVIVQGKVRGTWKRILKKDHVAISLALFSSPEKEERVLLEYAAQNYGRFLGCPITTTIL